jgi:WD40 repeat protein
VRYRWLLMVAGAGVLAAVAGTVLAVAVNVATGGTARWFPTMDRYPLQWSAGATAAVGFTALLVWGAQRRYDRRLAELVPAIQRPESWVVDRPGELNQVVRALRQRDAKTVGITTAVHGVGGFGKTTVAKMVRADPRILRRFGDRVHWVTLGRDAGKETLPALVNGLIAQIDPSRAVTHTDARQAGEHLAALLSAGPRRLLILDDVWSKDQLAAFPVTRRCRRLVTTRILSLADGGAVAIKVDQMTEMQARALLLNGLPPLPPDVVSGLLAETRRWPLLVHLVSSFLTRQAKLDPDIGPIAEGLLGRLRGIGALAVDQLTGAAARPPSVSDPVQRSWAIRATIEASTELLSADERARLAEVAVFAEDEAIPLDLVTSLWQETDGLEPLAGRALAARLADLALIVPTAPGTGTVIMHDVIRDYLSAGLDGCHRTELHRALVKAARSGLTDAPAVKVGAGTVTAWWELPGKARYLHDHLIEHLLAAEQRGEAEQLAADLRWTRARLQASGPAAAYADLALIGTPRTERLGRVLSQAAHLLAPTEPPHSLTDILYSRVSHDPDWGPQARALMAIGKEPALVSVWTLPDLPTSWERRALAGHTKEVSRVVIAPDGSWVATASVDGTARIWDAVTGRQRSVLSHGPDHDAYVEIAHDGTWLVTTGSDATAQIWDAATGRQRSVLTGHTKRVFHVAIAPDSSWLATASFDGTVRIWDAASGRQRSILTGHTKEVIRVAIAPDASWLASASVDGTVRIWDAVTGHQRSIITSFTGRMTDVVVAPDSTWLATISTDGTARICDSANGGLRYSVGPHSSDQARSSDHVDDVAIAPDGTWLVTTSSGTAHIRDAASGQRRATLTGHTEPVNAVAIAPDASWLATASFDGMVRIWDATSGRLRATLTGHSGPVNAVAIAPDGSWLATASHDGTARMWDATISQPASNAPQRIPMTGVMFTPDGTWLASTGADEPAYIWDTTTGHQRAILAGHAKSSYFDDSMTHIAIASEGTCLASGSGRSVLIWDTATWRQHSIFAGSNEEIEDVAIAPEGTWLATTGVYGTTRVWNVATRRQLAATGRHPASFITDIGVRVHHMVAAAIAPDSTWLATACCGSALIWDAASGSRRSALAPWLVAVGSGVIALVRDVATKPLPDPLDDRNRQVSLVTIAPDGTWLATNSEKGKARIWDAANGRRRVTLKGHTGPVTAVAIAPDGSWLATTSADGTARTWDAANGRLRAILTGHTGPVTGIAIAPDGKYLATTGRDGTVRVWDAVTSGISAVMRVDGALEDCAWNPHASLIAAAGRAGIYLFAFNS